MKNDILVEVDNLHVNFPTAGEHVEAVRGVSYEIRKGETLAWSAHLRLKAAALERQR